MDDPALTTSQNLVPLLTTKLRAPPLRAGLVSRPRLIDRLNAGLHCRFTLVSAPAGFGKTTLLSEWASSGRYNVAWLSLDAGDSDVHRFLSHLVASAQTVAARVGQWISHTLQASGTIDAEAALIALINDIASIPGGLILVLDDYHVIESSLVDQAVGFLVDHLPPPQEGVHLIIASRINPSLPLSRLRASGHMSEIRERDLRFTVDEASAFLEAVLGDRLTAEDVVTLETRTEGWIAGLQLAALSMQGLEDDRELAAFVGRFAGSHHYIQDYLADEVLKRQSQSTRDFLLQTSILERLSGPLCDFVRFGSPDVPHGETDSQTMLEDLEVSNLFLVPLDGERCWYRYHHLFADLLRARASRIYPDSQRQLHLRAADWLESMRMMSHAVHHALLAEDHDRAASLLEEAVSGTMLHGRLNTIFKWLDALPESVLNAHPRLRFYQAWALSLTGQPKVAEQMIARARTSLGALPQTARSFGSSWRTGSIAYSNHHPSQ